MNRSRKELLEISAWASIGAVVFIANTARLAEGADVPSKSNPFRVNLQQFPAHEKKPAASDPERWPPMARETWPELMPRQGAGDQRGLEPFGGVSSFAAPDQASPAGFIIPSAGLLSESLANPISIQSVFDVKETVFADVGGPILPEGEGSWVAIPERACRTGNPADPGFLKGTRQTVISASGRRRAGPEEEGMPLVKRASRSFSGEDVGAKTGLLEPVGFRNSETDWMAVSPHLSFDDFSTAAAREPWETFAGAHSTEAATSPETWPRFRFVSAPIDLELGSGAFSENPATAAAFPFLRAYESPFGVSREFVPVNPGLQFFGGVQYQNLYAGFQDFNFWGQPLVPQSIDLMTPQVGFQYHLEGTGLSGFYTYSQAFLNSGSNDPFSQLWQSDLSAGEIHQVGVSAEFGDGHWAISASQFYMEAGAMAPALTSAWDLSGLFNAGQGTQLRIVGTPADRWKTDLQVTRLQPGSASAAASGSGWRIPSNSSSTTATLWTRYDWISNADHRFGTGLGVRLTDQYKSSYENSLLIPGYSRWDAGLFYEREALESALYIQGFLDRRYYSESSSLFNSATSPLAVELQVRLRF